VGDTDDGGTVDPSVAGRPDAAAERHALVVERLEDQLHWFDNRAKRNRYLYQGLKVSQILLAAAVPVLSGANASAALVGSLGAAIVSLEGIQQLFQFHRNWVLYRSSAESLRRENHLFRAGVGHYAKATDPVGQLAQHVENLVSRNQIHWLAQQKEGEHRDKD
jgi:hypothetical protein